jgi:hypothetical protein
LKKSSKKLLLTLYRAGFTAIGIAWLQGAERKST